MVVTNHDGQAGTGTGVYTYQAAPTVTSVLPGTGTMLGGTSVTITGTGFLTGATVKFDTSQATSVAVVSGTTITCVTPAHATAVAVNVLVTNADNQTGTLNNGYTYTPSDPTVTGVSPEAGKTLAGTPVTITGTGFSAGATVRFGANTAGSITVVNPTTITCTAPTGTAGTTVNVSVQNTDNRIGTKVSAYTYQAAPTITTVAPIAGSTVGGTFVTITGTNFSTVGGNPTVTFGGAQATSVTRVSATTITCLTPAGTAGAVNVVVTNADTQFDTETNGFTYTATADPTVTSLSPNVGKLAVGTVVIITGTGFVVGTTPTVKFGATNAGGVNVDSTTQITCTAPVGVAGTVNVSVTNINGQIGILANAYTYEPVPTVISVTPPAGVLTGGTDVTITGTNFFDLGAGTTQVTFDGISATDVVRTSDTIITCKTPVNTVGSAIVIVTNPDGQVSTGVSAYTYQNPPTVTSLSPALGDPAGGTYVTITGTNFSTIGGNPTVTFDSVPATNVIWVSATSITCITPPHTAGTVDVVVTNADTQSGTRVNGFNYSSAAPDPTVTDVSPVVGKLAAGTPVTITGTGFLPDAIVKFGATNATAVVVVNSATITCAAPAGTAGTTVNVSVQNTDNRTGTKVSAYTYQAVPTITAVAPTAGSTAGGTFVTITGTNFSVVGGNPTVTFAGVAATSITRVSATSITCVTPIGTAGAKDVVVTNADTQFATSVGGFTYTAIADPTVTSLSPNVGKLAVGTVVTITGTGFVSGATVKFGAAAPVASTFISDTQITCAAPTATAAGVTGGGVVDVSVINLGGQAGIMFNAYTYEPAPTVTSVSPLAGALAGGTDVTITGTNFFDLGTVTPRNVTFDGFSATNVVRVNDTTITCTTPANTVGSAIVIVTNPDGQASTGVSAYTYQAAPTVTSLSPQLGDPTGGTFVTITGTGFSGVSGEPTVTFGGAQATSVTLVSATSITCYTPAHTEGSVDVVVTNADTQSGTRVNGFNYLVSPPYPTVTDVSPVVGKLAAGTPVTITGTGFLSDAIVKFGATNATSVVVVNATTITCIAPLGVAGTVNVTVQNIDNHTGTKVSAYTYQAAPTITTVAPIAGSTVGGTFVTITGTNFSTVGGNPTVTFGGAQATSVTRVSATTITCLTPAGTAGAVNVVVTNADTQFDTETNGFTYTATADPTVTSLSPNVGKLAVGTVVIITGTGFVVGTTPTVKFGATNAGGVNVDSTTQITCTAPVGVAGTVNVSVTNINGQIGILANAYTYEPVPTVISVTPPAGVLTGGTDVTITGTNFFDLGAGTTQVTFDGISATDVVRTSDTIITCKTPVNTVGSAIVIVTNPDGQVSTGVSAYTYQNPPTVTSLSPALGDPAGGTYVTITGTNFSTIGGNPTVTFGGVAATGVVVTGTTLITCYTPAHAEGSVDVVVTNADTQSGTRVNGFNYS